VNATPTVIHPDRFRFASAVDLPPPEEGEANLPCRSEYGDENYFAGAPPHIARKFISRNKFHSTPVFAM
jgi:hypothetical protein